MLYSKFSKAPLGTYCPQSIFLSRYSSGQQAKTTIQDQFYLHCKEYTCYFSLSTDIQSIPDILQKLLTTDECAKFITIGYFCTFRRPVVGLFE